MDIRYQVFISSTFRDLIDERQAALSAVLELNHMPSGMELFPAGDDEAWKLIQDVIDASDYYVLIVGGRYGSLDEEGISFTEKEYNYAFSKHKPVIALLHKEPENLPRKKTEVDDGAWNKLKEFRGRIEKNHTCVYWESVNELKSELIIGLTSEMKRHPATGWIRADQVPEKATVENLLVANQKIAELEASIAASRLEAPVGSEDLQQGADEYKVGFEFVAQGERFQRIGYTASISPTWDSIFAGIAPRLIGEISDHGLRNALKEYFIRVAIEDFHDDKDLEGKSLIEFEFDQTVIDTCIVQIRALGLIEESQRKRSIKDTAAYWKLTPYGDLRMVQSRALRRNLVTIRRPGKKQQTDRTASTS